MKFVRSKFRAPWKGVVINIEKRSNKLSPLYTCLIIQCKNGKQPKKRIIRTLDSLWLEEIKPLNITNINKDWFICQSAAKSSERKGSETT